MASDWPLGQQQRNTRLMRRWPTREAATWATATLEPPSAEPIKTLTRRHLTCDLSPTHCHLAAPLQRRRFAIRRVSFKIFPFLSGSRDLVTGRKLNAFIYSIDECSKMITWFTNWIRFNIETTVNDSSGFSFETPGRSATRAVFDDDRPANSEESLIF